MIEISRERQGPVMVVALAGRLDANNASPVEEEIEEVLRGGDHHISLDLEKLSYISSAGLSVLLQAYQQVKRLGGSLVISRASSQVTAVLELTGIATMLADSGSTAVTEETEDTAPKRLDGVTLIELPGEHQEELACTLVGEPSRLTTGYGTSDVTPLALPADTLAVGVGAFGDGPADCQDRFGELLAVGGCAAYLPGDGSKTPDFIVSTGALVPHVQALYALVLKGRMHRCFRFEGEEGEVALSRLVDAALELAGGEAVGFAMLAESAGLVGASLRRSPAPQGLAFAHPAVRQWLSITPECAFQRSLAVVVGVAARQVDPRLAPFLRPVGGSSPALAHIHAAAVTFRALPRGPMDLADTVSSLFSEQKLLGILHLLNDTREISGAGESHFVRGAIWVAPARLTEPAGPILDTERSP